MIPACLIAASCHPLAFEYEVIPLPTGIDDHLHLISFSGDMKGWVCTYGTGIIFHTTNGGLSWDTLSVLPPLYYERMMFGNDTAGWICGEEGSVYHTVNGGRDWLDRSIPCDTGDLLLYAMHFNTPGSGYVGGMTLVNTARQFIIYQTADSGRNWRLLPGSPPCFPADLHFISPDTGWICGSGHRICNTVNGGVEWDILFEAETKREGFRDMTLLTRGIIVAVSADGLVLRYSDGRSIWTATSITAARLRSVVFINDRTGFIAGDTTAGESGLYRTSNRGVSWQPIPWQGPDIHSLCRSPSFVWLAGKNGTIARIKI